MRWGGGYCGCALQPQPSSKLLAPQQIWFRFEFYFLSVFKRTMTIAQLWLLTFIVKAKPSGLLQFDFAYFDEWFILQSYLCIQKNRVEFTSTLTLFTWVTFLHCSIEVLNELRWDHWLCQGLMPSDWSKASHFTSFFKLVAKIQRRSWWFCILNKEQTWKRETRNVTKCLLLNSCDYDTKNICCNEAMISGFMA